MPTTHRVCAAVVTLAALGLSNTQGQSAADVINAMVSAYEKNVEGVDNYTLVQETMGIETVSYFEKEIVEGRPVFRLRQTQAMGVVMNEQDEHAEQWDEFYTMAPELISRATYEGREDVDGNSVHVISVTDLEELAFGPGTAMEDQDFKPQRARMYIDVDESLMRQMVFEGQLTQDGETHDVTSIVEFQDYREVEGMVQPFLIRVTMQGLGEAMDEEQRAQYEEMKK
ncbi:MAG: hypothetical protein JSW51_05190, partial [Gemmatimonadota bacterium]